MTPFVEQNSGGLFGSSTLSQPASRKSFDWPDPFTVLHLSPTFFITSLEKEPRSPPGTFLPPNRLASIHFQIDKSASAKRPRPFFAAENAFRRH